MREYKSGKVKVKDINIHYEIHGEGEPFLLIEGLGYSSWMWFKQIQFFSKEYKVIIFDNRGVGNTDKPDREYTIEMMADDAAGLLKALEIDSAHVLGVSMGGFIAQELALRYPEVVKRLVLVSTNSGGNNLMSKDPSLWNSFSILWGLVPGMLKLSGKGSGMVNPVGFTPEEKIRYGLSLAFSPEYFKTHTDEIDRIVEWRLANPQPYYAWKRQFMAGISFNAADRVHQIKSPTLIVTGSEDRVVSSESSRLLAEKIPNSKFKVIKRTGHLPFIEKSEEFNKVVLRFLKQGAKGKKKIGRRKWWRKLISFFSSK